jgi:DNA-binding NtrC family response regulator
MPRPIQSSIPGSVHLEKRSALLKRIRARGTRLDVLVVDDRQQDANFVETTLRMLFGADATVTVATTVQAMQTSLAERVFSVIVLDDRMDGDATADTTIPLILSSRNQGPIIVLSGLLTRARIAELKRLGASEMLIKDDADSSRMAEVILKVLEPKAAA